MRSGDKRSLSSVQPQAVARYLEATGWERERATSERFSVWRSRRDPVRAEVLLPSSAHFSDYQLRLREVLDVLERVEERSPDDILRDLRSAGEAVVTFRAVGRSDEARLRLVDGIALARAGFELVAAAARATAVSVTSSDARAELVQTFMAQVEEAAAEPGSFVMPLILPESVSTHGSADTTRPVLRGQNVKRQLEAILDDVETQSRQLDSERPQYWEANDLAVARALASLGELTELDRLSIELDPFTLGAAETQARRSFSFDGPAFRRLWTATWAVEDELPLAARPVERSSEELRTPEVQLVGLVVRLQRPSVTLRALVDGRVRQVVVRLSEADDYETAIDAHRGEVPVVCAGELVRVGKSLRLERVYLFRLAEE